MSSNGEDQLSNLGELPPSSHEYWEGANVELRKMEDKNDHTHFFKQVSSREIKCDCGVGFFIGVGDILKEGRLYHEDKLVI